MKLCRWCGTVLTQNTYSNGLIERPANVARRQFCGRLCNSQFKLAMPSDHSSAGRRRAQRLYPTQPCLVCGEKGQRHHKDKNPMNNAANNIEFLCASCHTKEHRANGDFAASAIAQSIRVSTWKRDNYGRFVAHA